MSVRVMSWVFERSASELAARLVLLAIADRANDEGSDAWPSIPTLAKKAHVDERTVRRSIERLERLGELRVERQIGRSHIYTVVMQPALPLAAGVEAPPTLDKLSPRTNCPGGQIVTPDNLTGGHSAQGTPGILPTDPSCTYKSTHALTPARADTKPSEPASRPPVNEPDAKPLGYRPRIDVAWPGRPPVPGGLHADFIQRLGGEPTESDATLRAWYPTVAAAWTDKPIGDDDWKFWRLRFVEWVGTTARPSQPPAPGRHRPATFGAQRQWTAEDLARLAAMSAPAAAEDQDDAPAAANGSESHAHEQEALI
jgi:hypothetical protein